MKKRIQGFNLIAMMLVIAIIGLLACILIPTAALADGHL